MKTFEVKSFSKPDVVHIVRQGADGSFHCDCQYFLYQGYKEGKCDHILRARHLKLKFHSKDVLHQRKLLKAIKRYNHLCRKYRFTNEKYVYMTEVQKKKNMTTGRLKDRLTRYKREIKHIVKLFPEIRPEIKK